jgi:hypothetical protein
MQAKLVELEAVAIALHLQKAWLDYLEQREGEGTDNFTLEVMVQGGALFLAELLDSAGQGLGDTDEGYTVLLDAVALNLPGLVAELRRKRQAHEAAETAETAETEER